MARYGLVVDTGDSPPQQQPATRSRRRMSAASGTSPDTRGGGATPSEAGSEVDSPMRTRSQQDLLRSSQDSLDSVTGAVRPSRRGSGFKRAPSKDGKRSKGGAKDQGHAAKSSFADVHVVGEIVGASGFTQPMLFCRWQLLYEPSKSWQVLRGLQQGATQACTSEVDEVDLVVWEHPLEVHMQTQSLQGWPALLLMVYAREESYNRDSFVSYGLVPLPSTPGCHKVSCNTWFAVESNRALGRTFFGWHTGLIPRLEDETFITDLRKREDAGPFICTVGAGEVHLRLNVLMRNLENVAHLGGESLAAALERLTTNILRASARMANKSAALEEHLRSSSEAALTEGQKLVRAGREERLGSARAAVDARRRGDAASPMGPSRESSRTSMFGRQASRGGAMSQDMGSETSYEYRKPKDRYADRAARRAKEKEDKERERTSQPTTPTGGGGGSEGGGGGPGSEAGTAPLSRAASAARPSEDDGMEEIGGVQRSGSGAGASEDGAGGGDANARAAARAARRQASRRLGY